MLTLTPIRSHCHSTHPPLSQRIVARIEMMRLAAICIAIVEGAFALPAHAKPPLSSRRAYRMGLSVHKRKYTVDDLDAMPEERNRYEIVDGELFMTPPPSYEHQRTQMRLIARLLPFVDSVGLELFAAPTAVRVSHITQVEPDLIVIPQLTLSESTTPCVTMSRSMLVVEIVSPSTRRVDRDRKRRLYLAEGVREYWIVDWKKRVVEVWAADSMAQRLAADVLVWQPRASGEPLSIALRILFDEVQA